MSFFGPVDVFEQVEATAVMGQLVDMVKSLESKLANLQEHCESLTKGQAAIMDELKRATTLKSTTTTGNTEKTSTEENTSAEAVVGKRKILILKQQVQEFAKTRNWRPLRTCMEAVLDHASQAYKQLQHVSYDEKHPMLRIGKNGHLRLLKVLLSAGMSVNTADGDGGTMLHGAARSGQMEMAELLLDRGAAADLKDKADNRPITLAAENNFLEMVILLLKHGVNVDTSGCLGMTSLHWAAMYGHLEVVRYLVEAGADTKARDSKNQTPLDLARSEHHKKVQTYLLELAK